MESAGAICSRTEKLALIAYIPIREICLRRTPLAASRGWASFFTFTTIGAIAGLWEVRHAGAKQPG